MDVVKSPAISLTFRLTRPAIPTGDMPEPLEHQILGRTPNRKYVGKPHVVGGTGGCVINIPIPWFVESLVLYSVMLVYVHIRPAHAC